MLFEKLLRGEVIEPVDRKVDIDLYRIVGDAAETLRTPGKKTPEKKRGKALAQIDSNTPIATRTRDNNKGNYLFPNFCLL